MNINIIVAFEGSRGIGFNNMIPWYFPEDLRMFSKVTKGDNNNAIIMGRKTWQSLPKKPLPKRQNIILSKTISNTSPSNIPLYDNEIYFNDISLALEHCRDNTYDTVWIIGGSEIYKESLKTLPINFIYTTEIEKHYVCDTFFPVLSDDFTCTNERIEIKDDLTIKYKIYKYIKNRKEDCL
jgi:dihydrofolate reductase